MTRRTIGALIDACLILLSSACRMSTPPPSLPDRSFCSISEQADKPTPTIDEVQTLAGRYAVALYSADSGKVLDHLDLRLIPTDTLHRSYQRVYDSSGAYRFEKRKQPLLAYGAERTRKWNANVEMPSIALYYSDKPTIQLFPPPRCSHGSCLIDANRSGTLLIIKQVTKHGFAGTVDQIGSVTAMRAPGQPWQLLGPHFFCALKDQ
jgi:hypothetical protein